MEIKTTYLTVQRFKKQNEYFIILLLLAFIWLTPISVLDHTIPISIIFATIMYIAIQDFKMATITAVVISMIHYVKSRVEPHPIGSLL